MPQVINVAVHSSQFPGAVRADLVNSLRQGAINHKFHYDSIKQAQKWLRLHEACSPARTDPEVAHTYREAFAKTARRLESDRVHVIGLGCGGGAKDCQLMKTLGRLAAHYTAVDVSSALVLTAWQAASGAIGAEHCSALVCDLGTAKDLPEVIAKRSPEGLTRLFTFFGMLPNFEPALILPRLAALVSPGDYLLCSANLAPGPDYRKGVERVLPLYDNDLTRDWLMTFLSDLDVSKQDGEMRFCIEEQPTGSGLLRISARFHFLRERELHLDSAVIGFKSGETLRLFFSYRHTAPGVNGLLAAHQINIIDRWISSSEEEGVFLASRG